jgi:hypothetical protein
MEFEAPHMGRSASIRSAGCVRVVRRGYGESKGTADLASAARLASSLGRGWTRRRRGVRDPDRLGFRRGAVVRGIGSAGEGAWSDEAMQKLGDTAVEMLDELWKKDGVKK